jgi:hypothetical protein
MGGLEQALRAFFDRGSKAVTASIETHVQNTLYALRSAGCERYVLARAEEISALVATISLAQRNGRPNLGASQLLRLRRLVFAH